jgi:O-succinylhomoserine sulfhydrylase
MKRNSGMDRRHSLSWRPATQAVRGGTRRSSFDENAEALFLTSGYAYDDAETVAARFRGDDPGFTYSRLSNPTVAMFEERMALIEGAEACRATATGMAAMTAALLSTTRTGDHVVASKAMFGSCRWLVDVLLPRFGVETTVVDGPDTDAWARARKPNTVMFFLESPGNPTLDIVDIPAVAGLAHDCGARLMVDNVFATPILQKPLELGADIVAYSATKHIDGQGRVLGGAVLGSATYVKDELLPFLRNTGPTLSAFNAWVLLNGLVTLDMRVRQMAANAQRVAEFLFARGIRVAFPGLPSHPQHALAMRQMSAGGTILSFEIDGGQDAAFGLLNALELIDISNNVGDARSLMTHPATTTHYSMAEADRLEIGVTPGFLRLSVGLEDPDDLIEDLDQSLRQMGL